MSGQQIDHLVGFNLGFTASSLTFEQSVERFRILVIGNANAGKTTILDKVCHAKGREPYCLDGKGDRVRSVSLEHRQWGSLRFFILGLD